MMHMSYIYMFKSLECWLVICQLLMYLKSAKIIIIKWLRYVFEEGLSTESWRQ